MSERGRTIADGTHKATHTTALRSDLAHGTGFGANAAERKHQSGRDPLTRAKWRTDPRRSAVNQTHRHAHRQADSRADAAEWAGGQARAERELGDSGL